MDTLPDLICFISSQGLECGQPVRWITKGWLVKAKRDYCFVMPCQLMWVVLR